MWDWIFPLGDQPDYEPDPSTSIAARARARGVSPMEEAYDRLLDDDGRAMLLVATSQSGEYSLDTVGELLHRDDVVLGLGDGGAHYGMICDASYTTFFLAHWARDRASGRFSVAEAVRELTSVPARVAGPGRPWPHRRRLQSRPERHRPRRPAFAQARSSATTCPPAAAGSTKPPTATSPPSSPAR